MASDKELDSASDKSQDSIYEIIDERVMSWLKIMSDKNMPISSAQLREKALEFAAELNLKEFKVSDEWLKNIQERYVLSNFTEFQCFLKF